MTESEFHRKIKDVLYHKLNEWYGASIPEYYDEAHALDVYAVTTDGISIYIEVIYDASRSHFRDDLLIIQRSNANLIFTIVNPVILKNQERVREYQKTQVSKRKSGIKMSHMINGDRILEEPNYVDLEFKQLVDTYLIEKREEVKTAQPNLEVYLLDENKDPTLELSVKPLYIIEKIVKKEALTPYQKLLKTMSDVSKGFLMSGLYEKKPSPDLIPIDIEVSNDGTIGAENIRIFLEFPPDCELFSERDVKGGYLFESARVPRGYSGLFVGDDKITQATLDYLGNDLMFSGFSPIYVRFPEKEYDVEILISIIQNRWPPKELKAIIHIQPERKEIRKVEWIN